MATLACSACLSALTTILRFSAPRSGEGEPTVPRGGFFVDPEPSARRWDENAEDWVPATSTGCVVVNPDDVLAVRWHDQDGQWIGCCGPDGDPEGNLVCRSCGTPVGTLRADCWTALEVRLLPAAVKRVADGEALPSAADHPDWFAELQGDPMTRAFEPEGDDDEDDDDDDDEDDSESSFSLWHLAVARGRVWVPADNAPLLAVIDADELTVETVIELPNGTAGLDREPPRWGIPSVVAADESVWITDVVDDGWFRIDASDGTVLGRLAADENGSDSPIGRALVWARTRGALAYSSSELWWCDDKDGRLRRLRVASGDTSVLSISGASVYAGFGKVWVTGSTNVIGSMGQLHRVDPTTGDVEVSIRLYFAPEAVAFADHALWMLGTAPNDYRDDLLHRLFNKTIDCDDEDYENETLLTRLDPDSLAVQQTTALEGQVHDLVSDGEYLYAAVFSVRQQGHRVIRIDPQTGFEDRRLSLTDIDVRQYNPPATPPVALSSAAFNARVRDVVVNDLQTAEIIVGELSLHADASAVALVLTATDASDQRFEMRCPLRPSTADPAPGDPERLGKIIATTFTTLWASRDSVSPEPGVSRLD